MFNCTGLGARDLFGDTELQPVRGQLAILLPQPEIRYAFTGDAGYMFPRADGILLGGTFERDDWYASRARRRSPASSLRTASCSPASAAPLELGRRGANLA